MSYILFLSTSSACGSVAACRVDRKETAHSERWKRGYSHAEALGPALAKIIKVIGGPSHICGIGCDVGPGSFTGIRVGINAARALAWAKRLPCFPISSSELAGRSWLYEKAHGVDGIANGEGSETDEGGRMEAGFQSDDFQRLPTIVIPGQGGFAFYSKPAVSELPGENWRQAEFIWNPPEHLRMAPDENSGAGLCVGPDQTIDVSPGAAVGAMIAASLWNAGMPISDATAGTLRWFAGWAALHPNYVRRSSAEEKAEEPS